MTDDQATEWLSAVRYSEAHHSKQATCLTGATIVSVDAELRRRSAPSWSGDMGKWAIVLVIAFGYGVLFGSLLTCLYITG